MKKKLISISIGIMLLATGVQVYAAAVLGTNIISLISNGFKSITSYYTQDVDSKMKDLSDKKKAQIDRYIDEKIKSAFDELDNHSKNEIKRADSELDNYVQSMTQEANTEINGQVSTAKGKITQEVNKKVNSAKNEIANELQNQINSKIKK